MYTSDGTIPIQLSPAYLPISNQRQPAVTNRLPVFSGRCGYAAVRQVKGYTNKMTRCDDTTQTLALYATAVVRVVGWSPFQTHIHAHRQKNTKKGRATKIRWVRPTLCLLHKPAQLKLIAPSSEAFEKLRREKKARPTLDIDSLPHLPPPVSATLSTTLATPLFNWRGWRAYTSSHAAYNIAVSHWIELISSLVSALPSQGSAQGAVTLHRGRWK